MFEPDRQPDSPSATVSRPLPPATRMPLGAWIVIALLGLATAALAGALFTSSLRPAAAPAQPASLLMEPATQPLAQPFAADAVPRAADTGAGAQVFRAAVTLPATAPAAPATLVAQAPAAVQAVPAAPVHGYRTPVAQRVAHTTHTTHPASPRARAASCADCGVVESVVPVRSEGQGTGLGAVTGGVLGGVIGNQVGGGNGKKAMTVLGAVGGGMAGHEIEKRQRATTLYSVKVRMADGTLRTVTQSTAPTVGQQVTVEGSQIRARG